MGIAGSKVHDGEGERNVRLPDPKRARTPHDGRRDEFALAKSHTEKASRKRVRLAHSDSETQINPPKRSRLLDGIPVLSDGARNVVVYTTDDQERSRDRARILPPAVHSRKRAYAEALGSPTVGTPAIEKPLNDGNRVADASNNSGALLLVKRTSTLEERFANLRSPGGKRAEPVSSPEHKPNCRHVPDNYDVFETAYHYDDAADDLHCDSSLRSTPLNRLEHIPADSQQSQQSVTFSVGLLKTISTIRTTSDDVPLGLAPAPQPTLSRAQKESNVKALRRAMRFLHNAHMAPDFSTERLHAQPRAIFGKTHRWVQEGDGTWRAEKIVQTDNGVSGSQPEEGRVADRKQKWSESGQDLSQMRLDSVVFEDYAEKLPSQDMPRRLKRLKGIWGHGARNWFGRRARN